MTNKYEVPVGQDIALSWSVVEGPKGLSIHYTMKSQSKADIWVLDRIQSLFNNRSSPDPWGAYRFERDGTLRLLLGAAPGPRRYLVTVKIYPYARRLPAGGTLEGDLTILTPVTEYNVYFASVGAPFELKRVDRVYLMVHYILAGPDITAEKTDQGPDVFRISPVTRWYTKLAISEKPLSLEVRRRTDHFSRETLPGERDEPM